MKIGALYQTKELYWFLYPSKDIARRLHQLDRLRMFALVIGVAQDFAAYWSKQLNCNVSYIEPNSIFCLLEQDGNFMKILSNNGELGWIILADWCKNYIEEVNQ